MERISGVESSIHELALVRFIAFEYFKWESQDSLCLPKFRPNKY